MVGCRQNLADGRRPVNRTAPGCDRRAGQNGGLIRRRNSPPVPSLTAAKSCPPPYAAARRLRRERPLQPLGQILAIIAPHHLVADAVGNFADALFQRRARARAWRSCRLRFRATRSRRQGRAPPPITSSIAARPPERARSSGSWPSGSSAKRRLFPGSRCGSARSAARHAAFCPALSPSKQRIGSSAIFHSSASWFSVSAVPSGATLPENRRRPWR